MPKARPVQQQRKRRVRMAKEAPFPVPIETVTGERASNSHWIYYTATLDSRGVTVNHTGDMQFLYRMGFFGKGSMSRGQPEWASSQRLASLPTVQPGSGEWLGMRQATVTSRRRYMTHLKWHLLETGDMEGVSQVDQDLQVTAEAPPPPPLQPDREARETDSRLQGEGRGQGEIGEGEDEEDMDVEEGGERTSWHKHSAEEETEHSVLAQEVKPSSVDDWGEGEGDADFWGTEGEESVSQGDKKTEGKVQSWDHSEGDTHFWGTEGEGEAVVESVSSLSSSQVGDKRGEPQKTCHSNSCPSGQGEGGGGRVEDRPSSQEQLSSVCVKSDATSSKESVCELNKHVLDDTVTNTHPDCRTNSGLGHETNLKLGSNVGLVCKVDRNPENACASVTSSAQADGVTVTVTGTATSNCGENRGQNTVGTNDVNSECTPEKNIEECWNESSVEHAIVGCEESDSGRTVHPDESQQQCSSDSTSGNHAQGNTNPPRGHWSEFCQELVDSDSDESDALWSSRGGLRLFVIADSDEEEVTAEGLVCRSRTRWKPVVRWEPFPVTECLHLSYEETFFLSYGLGCLTVLDSQQNPLSLRALWAESCGRQADFVPHYVAYHYYRSKNWVPKTGLKFGCTFLLYKDGPPFYHGSYSVVVQCVDEEGREVNINGTQRQFSWTSLAGLKRITEHVGKELLMCYVVKPSDMTDQDMLTPACIPRFKVKEMVLSRWLSSQERDKDGEELP